MLVPNELLMLVPNEFFVFEMKKSRKPDNKGHGWSIADSPRDEADPGKSVTA
jgi:hypothetical protein